MPSSIPFSFSIMWIPSMISWLASSTPRRSGFARTIESYGIERRRLVGDLERHGVVPGLEDLAAHAVSPAISASTRPRRRPTAAAKCAGLRRPPRPGEDTSIVKSDR